MQLRGALRGAPFFVTMCPPECTLGKRLLPAKGDGRARTRPAPPGLRDLRKAGSRCPPGWGRARERRRLSFGLASTGRCGVDVLQCDELKRQAAVRASEWIEDD